MKGKYSKLITEYCEQNKIVIPVGFTRRIASPIVIVRYDLSPPRLVARIYFNKEDANYYIKNILDDSIAETSKLSIIINDFT